MRREKYEYLLDRQIKIPVHTNLGEFGEEIALQPSKLRHQEKIGDGAGVVEQEMAILSVVKRPRWVLLKTSRIPPSRWLQVELVRVPQVVPHKLMRLLSLRRDPQNETLRLQDSEIACNSEEAANSGT